MKPSQVLILFKIYLKYVRLLSTCFFLSFAGFISILYVVLLCGLLGLSILYLPVSMRFLPKSIHLRVLR